MMDVYDSINTTTIATTTTTAAPFLPQYVGYIGCIVAVIFFGSNFIPVKKFQTGDGLFFQLILCIAIWIPSVVLHAIRGFPRFWPLAMLGGAIWASGNIMVVPIIQTVGMALGLLIWGTTNMLMGWASGRFGWFGLDKETPDNQTLNYLGVVACVISAIVSFFVKPHIEEPDNHSAPDDIQHPGEDTHTRHGDAEERDPLLPTFSGTSQPDTPVSINRGLVPSRPRGKPPAYDAIDRGGNSSSTPVNSSSSELDDEKYDDQHGDVNSLHHKLSPRMRRIVGVSMCLVSGALYGANFAPVIYIKNNYPKLNISEECTVDPCVEKVSQKDIDYVFAHFTGILLTSIFYFTIYCIIKKNKPAVYPKAILPAIVSGLMWSIADIGFFTANEVLEESVSFPIISAGPSLVAAFWGVFVFREIRGLRNLLIISVSVCLTLGGCIMCGLSK